MYSSRPSINIGGKLVIGKTGRVYANGPDAIAVAEDVINHGLLAAGDLININPVVFENALTELKETSPEAHKHLDKAYQEIKAGNEDAAKSHLSKLIQFLKKNPLLIANSVRTLIDLIKTLYDQGPVS